MADPVADSSTKTTQSDSGTGTTQADVAAAVRAAAAAAQTAATQAAAASAAAQAAATSFSQQEAVPDISQAEAYMINMKNLVEQLQLTQSRIVHNALTFDEQTKQIALQNLQLGQQALANAVALANKVNNQTVKHSENLDAQAISERERTVRVGDVSNTIQQAALADNPVLQDTAIAAAVVAAIKTYKEEVAKA